MGLFSIGKKKEEMPQASVPETLPPPPSIESVELPPLPDVKSSSKLRFPTLPFKKATWKLARKFEERAYRKEKKMLQHRENMEINQPLFIRSTEYKELATELEEARSSLKRAGVFTINAEDLNAQREEKFEELRKDIETIQRKLIFMDKTLFK